MSNRRCLIKTRIVPLLVVLLASLTCANAQDPSTQDDCVGPVYKGKEVTRRVKLLSYPPPEMPNDSRASDVKGLVILDVVACKDGRVTNIAVVQKQPYGLTETAIKAARKVKFRPAEKDGQLVSQRMRFEYHFGM